MIDKDRALSRRRLLKKAAAVGGAAIAAQTGALAGQSRPNAPGRKFRAWICRGTGSGRTTLQELTLLGADEFPFTAGRLVNAAPPANAVLNGLPAVNGITVNTVHGRDASIDDVRRRLAPAVESMEGAAFMYACLVHGLPFAQVRAVSNIVERRNRAAWNIPGAVLSLAETARRILEDA